MSKKKNHGLAPVQKSAPGRRLGVWAGIVAGVAVVLLLAYFEPWTSPFAGTWVKTGGASAAPETMQLEMVQGRMRASFTDRNPMSIGSVSFMLILDGRAHAWSGESGQQGFRKLSSYAAWVDRSTLHLKRQFDTANGPSRTVETQWRMEGHNRLVVASGDSRIEYRRQSWFGSLLAG